MNGTDGTERDIVLRGASIGGDSTIRFAEASSLARLADAGRTVVVADSLTAGFVPAEFPRDRIVTVERGEGAKRIESLDRVYAAFLAMGVGRDWTVVGIGGGSVTDLAGFAASTWMRGLDFGFMPTTLLAMVDASVGGKNGIDYGGRKNLVGCFRQPRFVLMDLALLESLPARDMACGMAEAIKHGVIDGEAHFSAVERAVRTDGSVDRGALGAVVRASVQLKAAVAAEDEFEEGPRRSLNLGHTFGHAIEAVSGLPHGECVAVGLACAFRLAVELGASAADASRVAELVERLGLPATAEGARLKSRSPIAADPERFRAEIRDALSSDKKRAGGLIHFAMPRAIGDVRIESVTLADAMLFAGRMP